MLVKQSASALLIFLLASCATAPAPAARMQPIPESWNAARMAPAIAGVTFGSDGRPATAIVPRELLRDGEVHVTEGKITRASEPLTPSFASVQSFDVSDERREIVFSARREKSLDIGLVSLDGSHINWVPEEPADEISVQWAPRGNKVSYVVRAHSGDLVRTVHIPTSYQLTVDFPWGRVTDLAWDAAAERFAVVVDSIDASSRVEVMKYDGRARETAIAAARRLDISIEPAGAALLLRPSTLKYGERLPVVVWVTDGDRNRWNDARGRLLAEARVAIVLIGNAPDAALREMVATTQWIDATTVYVVDARAISAPVEPAAGELLIRTSATVPAGQWLRSGSVIETAGSVESFAASFIAEQLKGTPSPNGHR